MDEKKPPYLLWLIVALVIFSAIRMGNAPSTTNATLAYSEFLDKVQAREITKVTINENVHPRELYAETRQGTKIKVTGLTDTGLIGDLIANNVLFTSEPRQEPNLLMTILVSWGPMLLLIGVWIYFMKKMRKIPCGTNSNNKRNYQT